MEDLMARYRVPENPLKAERRLELVLVVLTVALLLMVVYAVLGIGRNANVQPIAPAADALAPVAGVSPVIPGLEESSEIEGRPLFWAGRRPLSAAQVGEGPGTEDAAKQTRASGTATLKGVQLLAVFADGEQGVVIFLAEGRRHRVAVGEKVEGWTLESVDAFGMNLRSGAEVRRVELTRRAVSGRELPMSMPSAAVTRSGALSETEAKAEKARRKARREEADNTLSFGGG